MSPTLRQRKSFARLVTLGMLTVLIVLSGAGRSISAQNSRTSDAHSGTCTTNPIVTTTADGGAGSLRQAILDACDGSTISFSSLFATNQTITLASTLGINKSLTIGGPGANLLTISGNNTVRVFAVGTIGTAVTFSGVSIANGSSAGNNPSAGGGISNSATLNIVDSAVVANTVNNTCVGSLCIGSTGGGINNTGTINLTRSTISGNSVVAVAHGQQGSGAGIFNTGTLTITSSTIANNSASGSSGGASGGGVFTEGLTTITTSTIAGNSASGGTGGDGAGVYVGSQSTTSITNTIIANNSATLQRGAPEVKGTFSSNGYNLIGRRDGSTGFTNGVNHDQVGSVAAPIDPLLGTLANNGGTTQTMALLPASPAIDKSSAVSGITADQRGLARPVDLASYTNAGGGDGSDIGACELQAGTPDHLSFSVQPSDTIAGGTITPAVAVTILDGSNNPTTSTANVTLTIGTNPGSGTLGGNTTIAAVNGTATFSDLSINKSGIGYTLVAGSTVSGVTSNSFSITCSTITLSPLSLPNGSLGFSYNNTITATGGAGPFSFAVSSGSVPTGLTLNSNGTWSGAPTTSGTFNFRVTVTASTGCNGNQDYAVMINALAISGRVTRSGNGFGGVTITLSGAQSNSTVTDANGNYSFTNIAGNASYTVTPSRTNYSFTPTNAIFNNIQGSGTADFAGTLVNYNISGRVTLGAGGLGGVTVALSGGQAATTVTDASGNYSFPNVAGDGNYAVTPSLAGYTFNPPNHTFTNLSANQTADFVAMPRISGQIKDSNNQPIANVIITLSGTTSATVVSDGNGDFSFAGLTVGGNYVVTPARTNYTFSPTLRTFTNLTSGQTADFVGTLVNYTISGRVTDNSNVGIGGISLNLSGSQTATTMTAANGSYSFTVPGDGNYTLTPASADYAFAPQAITFNVLSQNQTAANFTATAIPHLMLDQSGPDAAQAAALDALMFLRDPFPVINNAVPFNSGSDRNTRVIIFAANLQLASGEPASSVMVNLSASNNLTYDIAAEEVPPVPNFAMTQVTFRLPDNLAAGTCIIKITVHGQVSNAATFRIQN